MSARETLKNEIKNKAVVHGKVILSSGKEADYYVDLRRITLDHVAAPLVGEVMLELTKELDYEAVGMLQRATAAHSILLLFVKKEKLTDSSAASRAQM
jgi:orotate phosphoribosyltransferase